MKRKCRKEIKRVKTLKLDGETYSAVLFGDGTISVEKNDVYLTFENLHEFNKWRRDSFNTDLEEKFWSFYSGTLLAL